MHKGSCLCGEIEYEVDSELKAIVHCHCRFCRKAHGAPFTTVLFIPFANLKIVKGKESVASYHVESVTADRRFCSRCGTRLYNHLPQTSMASSIVATLDLDEVLRPVAHVNTESKCNWFAINDDLPQFLGVPPPEEFRQLLAK